MVWHCVRDVKRVDTQARFFPLMIGAYPGVVARRYHLTEAGLWKCFEDATLLFLFCHLLFATGNTYALLGGFGLCLCRLFSSGMSIDPCYQVFLYWPLKSSLQGYSKVVLHCSVCTSSPLSLQITPFDLTLLFLSIYVLLLLPCLVVLDVRSILSASCLKENDLTIE